MNTYHDMLRYAQNIMRHQNSKERINTHGGNLMNTYKVECNGSCFSIQSSGHKQAKTVVTSCFLNPHNVISHSWYQVEKKEMWKRDFQLDGERQTVTLTKVS